MGPRRAARPGACTRPRRGARRSTSRAGCCTSSGSVASRSSSASCGSRATRSVIASASAVARTDDIGVAALGARAGTDGAHRVDLDRHAPDHAGWIGRVVRAPRSERDLAHPGCRTTRAGGSASDRDSVAERERPCPTVGKESAMSDSAVQPRRGQGGAAPTPRAPGDDRHGGRPSRVGRVRARDTRRRSRAVVRVGLASSAPQAWTSSRCVVRSEDTHRRRRPTARAPRRAARDASHTCPTAR